MGWQISRQRGSHVILNKRAAATHVVVPISRREIPPGTMAGILRQAGLTSREFEALEEATPMTTRRFTAVLIPDEDAYQVVVPRFPNCTTWGSTPAEALANAREAMTMLVEDPSEIDLEALQLPSEFHVIVGNIEVEVPDELPDQPAGLVAASRMQ